METDGKPPCSPAYAVARQPTLIGESSVIFTDGLAVLATRRGIP
jgi:hypothetical protein